MTSGTRMIRILSGVAAAALALAATWASAGDRGSVTNLPIPRYVSLKVDEGNVRRGPSSSHRIDWVLQRRYMPLQVVDEYDNWRRVVDRDGVGGWVHYSLLSGMRTVLVEQDMLPLLMKPDPAAPANAQVEVGVVARLEKCLGDWCRIRAGGYSGWAPAAALWGLTDEDTQQ